MSYKTCSAGAYILSESVVEDTLQYRSHVDSFLLGEMPADDFKAIRVAFGIYEQSLENTFLVRVRGAGGVFLSQQAAVVSELSKAYGNSSVRVTTRQNLQIHDVKIEHTPDIVEKLLEVGLSTRGGGGNTVRNISACPLAGVCRDEVFDVTPYSLALTEYLLRDRGSFSLPRKFKVALSGCGRDCGLASVADLGFFAHERDGIRGFAVYAGGGMGAHSALAVRMEEFVPAEDVFAIAEAVKRLFNRHGDRTNRARARLRYAVDRMGADQFRQAYREELRLVRERPTEKPEIKSAKAVDDPMAVTLTLPSGEIDAEHLAALADVADRYGDGTIRTVQSQDLQVRVAGSSLDAARTEISGLNAEYLEMRNANCVSCIGAPTCRLGRCQSQELADSIQDRLAAMTLPVDLTIRVSGCHNSCGHHPIAALGFYGSPSRLNGELIQYYTVVAGGCLAEGGSELAQPVGKLRAEAIPALVEYFLREMDEKRFPGEDTSAAIKRWGIGSLREICSASGEKSLRD